MTASEKTAPLPLDPPHDPSAYPPFGVTADIVVFTVRDDRFQILLVERGRPPFLGRLALPGGFLQRDESAEQAARRELLEETGLDAGIRHLEQLGTYSEPDRDPRQRVVTVAFWAILPDPGPVRGDTDAERALWVPVGDLEAALDTTSGSGGYLAFDHDRIVEHAIQRARSKLEYTSVATNFCQPRFTMTELRQVYEAVWGRELEPANFRRKIELEEGLIEATGLTTRDLDSESGRTGRDRPRLTTHRTRKPQFRHGSPRPDVFREAEPGYEAAALRLDAPVFSEFRTFAKPDLAVAGPPPVPEPQEMGTSDEVPTRRGRPAALYTKGNKDELDQPFRRPRS